MKKSGFIKVDEWTPKKNDNIVYSDGKLVIVPFDIIFNRQDCNALNNFLIKKESYVKRLPELTQYINYFIKFYDDNNEMIIAYLKLKSLIDNKSAKISIGAFIKYMYNILLSDTMVKKIVNMTEDNYYVDLSSHDGVKYNETLEFTNEHGKIMMSISIAMKIMVPLIFHYLNTYNLLKDKNALFRFYEGLFDLFGGEVDIYNKLWISIYSVVNVSYVRNKVIWNQREMFDSNTLTHMDELLKDKIISETMVKYKFDKNIVNFNHVVLRRQLMFFLIEPYKTNRIELSAKKDTVTGLSGLDKLEMNSSKIDESIIILSEINIKETIKRLEKKMHMKISKEEVEYYKDNLKITKFHTQLVFYYFAKYFGGYRDLNSLGRKKYLKLLVILKKRLQYQGYEYLPQIFSSNIESKLNARTIRNDKFLSKIESAPIYQSLMENKYSTLTDVNKSDLIINLLSTLLNTTFTFVDYDHQDLLGKPIEIDQDKLADEFLNFINQF